MSLFRKLALLLPWVRRAEDRDMQAELAALREMAGPHELGNLTLAAEDARGAQTWLWLERLVQDVRFALRSMAHNKGFTALVVTSLALGIGANTAVYSFMDGILLRPLPVRDPHSLVVLKWHAKEYSLATSGMSWSTGGSSFDPATGTTSSIFPYGALKVFEDAKDVVATSFGYTSANRMALTAQGETIPVKGQYVTGRYFEGMGVTPIAGRVIQESDDVNGAAGVAVLSQRYSQRIGGPQASVGQTVRIDDKPFVVIGVVPSAFFGAEPGAIPDVYVPMRADSILGSGPFSNKYSDDHLYWLEIMARLKPGVSLQQAQAMLAPRFRQFAEGTVATTAQGPGGNDVVRALATAEKQRADLPTLVVQSGATGLDSLRREYSRPIYVLMTMVALILLIACSNIANLLLSRAAARRREIAVRLSIGASRGRVIRQLLTESVLLAVLGGLAGIAVASWGVSVLTDLLSRGRDNFTLHAELNWTVLTVTFGLAALTGLLFGLAPALQATRVDVAPALKEVRANPAPRRRLISLSQMLVLAQIVFSLVLLVAAGLFGRTLSKLHAIELGFDRENILLLTIRPGSIGYTGPSALKLYQDIRAELARLPGVQRVSLSAGALPLGGGTMARVGILGATATASDGRPPSPAIATVGPDFFATMGIPLAGRDMTEADTASAPKVVIVNKHLARAFGLDNPIGRTLTMGKDQFEIVGLANDSLTFTLKEERRPAVFFPYTQATRVPYGMVYEVRTAGDPMSLAGAVRQVVRQVDSRIAVHDVKSQASHIDQAISSEITLARLCTAFGVLALVIACVGLYGTVAYNVSRRTTEIGIRMTLGARRLGIVWMVLRDVLIVTAVGLLIGVPVALAGSGYVRALLFGIEPTDPVSIVIGAGALVLCALIAGLIPAQRAARIDPMVAVRHE
ncbi:MAG TPA: ABC transporter permease [Vicinamibacterales bacterium]|nr:ABC transporter permease [Vicinamibacterales bacterium]